MERSEFFTMSTEVVPPVDMHEEEYEGRLVLVSRNPLGVGVGKASAEIESFDEALELSRKLAESVEATNVESTDCGDGREFAVSGLRTLAASDGIVIAASWWGKIKTVTQMAAIITLLVEVNIVSSQAAINFVSNNAFLNGFFTYVPNILLILAVIITIISGVDYIVKNFKVLKG